MELQFKKIREVNFKIYGLYYVYTEHLLCDRFSILFNFTMICLKGKSELNWRIDIFNYLYDI